MKKSSMSLLKDIEDFLLYIGIVIVIDLLYLDYHNSEDIAQIFSSNLTRARF